MTSQDTSRVVSLIAQWELGRSSGHILTPEELCRDHPELLEEVKGQLAKLEQFPTVREETKSFDPNSTIADRPPATTTTSSPSYPSIPNFSIERELGQGGMGVVYLARQVRLNRLVAIKMIRKADHLSEESMKRFRAEAETLARFQNPHVVHIYEVNEHNGQLFIVMEYIAGKTLRALFHSV